MHVVEQAQGAVTVLTDLLKLTLSDGDASAVEGLELRLSGINAAASFKTDRGGGLLGREPDARGSEDSAGL